MTVLLAGGTVLAILVVVLVAGGWRLFVLDRDLTRLDEELMRLQDELSGTQQQLQARDERLRETTILTRQMRRYLEWLDPWAQYLIAVSQERDQ